MSDLKKGISLYGLTMVAIGSCIGAGIFITPSDVAHQIPSSGFILLAWTIGGIIALTGALTFAELGSMFPNAGGVYVYLKEAYGDMAGFLYGWATLLIVNTGSIAALTLAFAKYLSFLIPMSENWITATAILGIAGVTIVNIMGVNMAGLFSNLFTGIKLLGIIGLIITGIFLNKGAGTAINFSGMNAGGEHTPVVCFLLGLVGVIWSFGGWQHASFLAAETQNPQRNVPRAMIIGAAVVTLVYILVNLSYLLLLPVETMGSSKSVAADAFQTVFAKGGMLVALLIAISTLGTAGIYTLSAPRIYFAMAKDKLFFEQLARLHPRTQVPVNAILVQSIWAIGLLLFWKTFSNVITYVVFSDWMFMILAAMGIFIFRVKRKNLVRSYKTAGYPVTPLIFILISAAFVVNTFIEKPQQAWAGLIIVASGLVVYIYYKQRNKSR